MAGDIHAGDADEADGDGTYAPYGDGDTAPPPRPELDHVPLRPGRAGRMEETVFLSGWQALMRRTQAAPLDHPTRDGFVRATQRDASLAASLAQWLGTNAGACLVQEGRRLAAAGLQPQDAFLAAWAVHNVRLVHVNTGLRSIEWLMSPDGCDPSWAEPVPAGLPEPTIADIDLVEHVVRWLGTPAGLAFVAAREAEIEACKDVEHERLRAANRGGPAWRGGLSREETLSLLAVMRAAEARGAAAHGR